MDTLNIQVQLGNGAIEDVQIKGQYIGQFFVSKAPYSKHWQISHVNGKLVKGYLNRKKEVVYIANKLELLGLDFDDLEVLTANKHKIQETLRESISEAYKL